MPSAVQWSSVPNCCFAVSLDLSPSPGPRVRNLRIPDPLSEGTLLHRVDPGALAHARVTT
jgi:hypothetical protein